MCIQIIMKNVVFSMAAIVMALASREDEATMAWKNMAEPGPVVQPLLQGRIEPESVDCVWGEYGEWSSCSATCDGGTRTRTRPEATSAAYGGAACNGPETETEACKTEACPACTFEKFDGPVQDKGGKVGFEMGIDLEGCKVLCNENNACHSFVYQPKKEGCYLKDKKLDGTEQPARENPNFFSVRKICEKVTTVAETSADATTEEGPMSEEEPTEEDTNTDPTTVDSPTSVAD